ncbi:MAG: beta-lactamase family protein [bacterium]|nr:beta-lactamase family protein [bacterium]
MPSTAGNTSLEDAIRNLAESRLAQHESPSLSVAVVAESRITLAAAGYADPEAGIPATPETLYQAASISKLITATLVARQLERGKLELDASANRYLPRERWIRDRNGTPVTATIRQLLTHTAGLPVRGTGDDPMTLASYLVNRLRTARPAGQKIVYSNQGYALLGYLAAVADGQTFAEHARTVLFEPLGMSDSTFRPPSEFEARLPIGYGRLFGALSGRVERKDPSPLTPAAGLITTARDLARFALLFLRGGELEGQRILRRESVAEMLRIHARQHPALDEGYGLGFMVRDREGQVLAWHDGGIPGASARLALDPGLGIAAVALSNSVAAEAPTGFIADALELIGRREPEPAREPTAPTESAPDSAYYRLVDVLSDDLWLLNVFFNLEVDMEGDTPVLRRFPALSPLEVKPLGRNRFLVRGWLVDGAVARTEGDRLYVGIIEARRVAVWESARAFLAYSAILLFSAPVFLAVRWHRRARS